MTGCRSLLVNARNMEEGDGDSLHPIKLKDRLFLIFRFNHQIAINR
jgi:hypothetical protein